MRNIKTFDRYLTGEGQLVEISKIDKEKTEYPIYGFNYDTFETMSFTKKGLYVGDRHTSNRDLVKKLETTR